MVSSYPIPVAVITARVVRKIFCSYFRPELCRFGNKSMLDFTPYFGNKKIHQSRDCSISQEMSHIITTRRLLSYIHSNTHTHIHKTLRTPKKSFRVSGSIVPGFYFSSWTTVKQTHNEKKTLPCPGIGIVSHLFTVSIKFASEYFDKNTAEYCHLCEITTAQVYVFCFSNKLSGMWAKKKQDWLPYCCGCSVKN